MSNELIIELRDYLEKFIESNKGRNLHLLDISMHLTEIKIFADKLNIKFNEFKRKQEGGK